MPILTCPIAEYAKRSPNQTAIQLGNRPISFAELNDQVFLFQEWLRSKNILGGSRLVFACTTPEWVIPAMYACFREQVIAVSLNKNLPALVALAQEIDGSALLMDRDLMDLFGHSSQNIASLSSFSTQFSTQQWATFVRTSGTSGTPKWAVHSIGNHSFSAIGANQNMPLTQESRWLLTLPLFHVGGIGLVFRCFLTGASVVIDLQKRPLLSTLLELQPTHVSLVPTQLFWLVKALEENQEALKNAVLTKVVFLVGGAALPIGLAKRAIALGLHIHPTYGLTEMSSQVATASAPMTLETIDSIGPVLCCSTIKIDSSSEVWVKGDPLFQGYWDQDKVSLLTDPDGFFPTGDLGALDSKGRLRISGRKDSLIISGGENIQPEEIESALLSISGVLQVVVVPRPDEEFGQRPVAFIKTEGLLLKEFLIEELTKVVPKFKIPDDFFPWPELPETGLKLCRSDFMKRLG